LAKHSLPSAANAPVMNRLPTSRTSTVTSPCVRDCCLDEAEVCMGCGRTLQDILRWLAASDAEREAILVAAKARVAERRAARRW
jgi:predicted Fe-S protein YdhL (DUF1289 family)